MVSFNTQVIDSLEQQQQLPPVNTRVLLHRLESTRKVDEDEKEQQLESLKRIPSQLSVASRMRSSSAVSIVDLSRAHCQSTTNLLSLQDYLSPQEDWKRPSIPEEEGDEETKDVGREKVKVNFNGEEEESCLHVLPRHAQQPQAFPTRTSVTNYNDDIPLSPMLQLLRIVRFRVEQSVHTEEARLKGRKEQLLKVKSEMRKRVITLIHRYGTLTLNDSKRDLHLQFGRQRLKEMRQKLAFKAWKQTTHARRLLVKYVERHSTTLRLSFLHATFNLFRTACLTQRNAMQQLQAEAKERINALQLIRAVRHWRKLAKRIAPITHKAQNLSNSRNSRRRGILFQLWRRELYSIGVRRANEQKAMAFNERRIICLYMCRWFRLARKKQLQLVGLYIRAHESPSDHHELTSVLEHFPLVEMEDLFERGLPRVEVHESESREAFGSKLSNCMEYSNILGRHAMAVSRSSEEIFILRSVQSSLDRYIVLAKKEFGVLPQHRHTSRLSHLVMMNAARTGTQQKHGSLASTDPFRALAVQCHTRSLLTSAFSSWRARFNARKRLEHGVQRIRNSVLRSVLRKFSEHAARVAQADNALHRIHMVTLRGLGRRFISACGTSVKLFQTNCDMVSSSRTRRLLGTSWASWRKLFQRRQQALSTMYSILTQLSSRLCSETLVVWRRKAHNESLLRRVFDRSFGLWSKRYPNRHAVHVERLAIEFGLLNDSFQTWLATARALRMKDELEKELRLQEHIADVFHHTSLLGRSFRAWITLYRVLYTGYPFNHPEASVLLSSLIRPPTSSRSRFEDVSADMSADISLSLPVAPPLSYQSSSFDVHGRSLSLTSMDELPSPPSRLSAEENLADLDAFAAALSIGTEGCRNFRQHDIPLTSAELETPPHSAEEESPFSPLRLDLDFL